MLTIPWLRENDPEEPFPDPELALDEPDGLLAAGGDLHPARLINAYQHGIFPWFSNEQPILWWSPDPRLILYPKDIKVSRSLKKSIRKQQFHFTINQDFEAVIELCQKPRPDQEGTWITEDMKHAYINLHEAGYAHSFETRIGDELVGGLYGVCIDRVFFGESMFHTATDASKSALFSLCTACGVRNIELIDCQVQTEHLLSLGAQNISRKAFTRVLEQYCVDTNKQCEWSAIDINKLVYQRLA